MEDHEPFVERILHKLVRKHIAGTTMESALAVAKQLNSSSIPASITFLSGNVIDKSKARYNATAYAELVRRIARAGIKSSIHVKLEQLGSEVDPQVALDNVGSVAQACQKYGIFLWVEPEGLDKQLVSKVTKMKGVGLAVEAAKASDYMKGLGKVNSLKLSFREYDSKDPKDVSKMLAEMNRNVGNIVVSSMNEKLLWKVASSKQKADVTFEFMLGYSSSKMKKAVKKGTKISVLVPFGKDWIKYAMNNVPEAYMRFVAGRLLKGEVA